MIKGMEANLSFMALCPPRILPVPRSNASHKHKRSTLFYDIIAGEFAE